jgi:hypothetical protein
MPICRDIIGLGSWESIQGFFVGIKPNYLFPLVVEVFIYGGLCTIYFFKELGCSGSVSILRVLYFW